MDFLYIGLVIGLTFCCFEEMDGETVPLTLPAEGLESRRKDVVADVKALDCVQIGNTCSVDRKPEVNPRKVTYTPCCEFLHCLGFGPTQVLDATGQTHHSTYAKYSGICAIDLDKGGGDLDAYKNYVNRLTADAS